MEYQDTNSEQISGTMHIAIIRKTISMKAVDILKNRLLNVIRVLSISTILVFTNCVTLINAIIESKTGRNFEAEREAKYHAEQKESGAKSSVVKVDGSDGTVFISSIPPIAEIYMDGVYIGKTNISKVHVRSGVRTMKFVKGDKEHTREMTFVPGDNQAKHVSF